MPRHLAGPGRNEIRVYEIRTRTNGHHLCGRRLHARRRQKVLNTRCAINDKLLRRGRCTQ
jgi:hypothetical protein